MTDKLKHTIHLRHLYLILFLSLVSACAPKQYEVSSTGEREFTILHINDVYRIDGINNGRSGGLARVRALRKQLAKKHGKNILFLHAGDLLFPSPMSSEFKGLQVINTLNLMDGSEKRFDDLMLVAFGNHEFDQRTKEQVGVLEDAVGQSKFNWLNTNVVFDNKSTLTTAGNVMPNRVMQINGIKIGIFGVTTNVQVPEYAKIDGDYVSVAKTHTALLREQGAEVVIALTHLTVGEDKDILGLGDLGPDVIFGGHEHIRFVEKVGARKIIKADADAVSASVTKISVNLEGAIDVATRFEILDDEFPVDARILSSNDKWQTQFIKARCGGLTKGSTCLDKALVSLPVELIGTSAQTRQFETNLGNWTTGVAMDKFADYGADIAFINSGGLRLNQNLPAGSNFTRQHLAELLPYQTELQMIDISGAELQQIVDHSVAEWGSKGWWLQISGFAFRHNPSKSEALELSKVTDTGLVRVRPDDRFKAVTTRYVLDKTGNQDGYTFLNSSHIVDTPIDKVNLASVFEAKLLTDDLFIPQVDGRICNREYDTPCLFD